MVNLYIIYKGARWSNEKNNWDSVSYDDLMRLYVEEQFSDRMVAELYGVTKSQVAYRRKKLGIRKGDILYKEFISKQNPDMIKRLNEKMKNHLMSVDVSLVSRAIAHYAFRNGPVEDMHSNGQLSENDMKTLNKYINNKLATFLTLLKEQDWVRLSVLIDLYGINGCDWDKPEIDFDEIDKLIKLLFKEI